MGRREFPELRLAERLDSPLPPTTAADPAHAVEERTEVKLARLAVEHSRAQSRLAQAYTRPNLDVLFGYKRSGGLDTVLGGVQFDLPLFNRNQGNVASAASEIRAAESAAAAAEAVVRAEVEAARTESEIRRRQIEEALRPMLDQADESSRIAQAAYREGGADLLRLLDAERVRLETRMLYVQMLASFRQSLAALETAMGVAP